MHELREYTLIAQVIIIDLKDEDSENRGRRFTKKTRLPCKPGRLDTVDGMIAYECQFKAASYDVAVLLQSYVYTDAEASARCKQLLESGWEECDAEGRLLKNES